MTQFKTEHGVIVDVDDELAARIGGKWKPVGAADELPEGKPDASWTLPQLKAFASEHGIDLDGAKKKPEILAAIAESDDESDDSGAGSTSDE